MSRSLASSISYRERAIRTLERLPPLSPTLTRLIATMARDDVSFSELGGLIEKDAIVAGHVLRLVNSAAYGHSGTVGSVRHALTLMGLTKLRNVVIGLSISRLWTQVRTTKNWSPVAFNQHSVATAILSDLLAARVPTVYPEGAFTAGLLHDMGKLMLAITFADEFDGLEAAYHAGASHTEEDEMERLGVTHAELSAAALSQWNLPPELQQAVRYHHAPDRDYGFPDKALLSRIVWAADRIVNGWGVSLTPYEDEVRAGADQPVAPDAPAVSSQNQDADSSESGHSPDSSLLAARESAAEVLETLGLASQTDAILAEFDGEFELMSVAC